MNTMCSYCGSLNGGHTLACQSIHIGSTGMPAQVPAPVREPMPVGEFPEDFAHWWNYSPWSDASRWKDGYREVAYSAWLAAKATSAVPTSEWRWVDEKGRAMTNWKQGEPPSMSEVSDDKGTMRVETRKAAS